MSIYDLMDKYKKGSKLTYGINLDWSLIFMYGIPDIWRITVLTD